MILRLCASSAKCTALKYNTVLHDAELGMIRRHKLEAALLMVSA